ncbi:MAG TPA: PVC-type heme-binding CxxCH protein [Planctomycetaceae bacterium]|jgi:putative membrane-bound dehydrogenase-like protein|nr:PVC-type heme-binding CxxCH protein [Planctomycetaceae bacterium]
MSDSRIRLVVVGLVAVAIPIGTKATRADDEARLFTPPGFSRPGQAVLKPPSAGGHLKLTVRDARTGEPTFCRVNVVGPDGNFYYPKQNYLTRFALTGQWTGRAPNRALGNRLGKAPIRYVGRFFYSWGQSEVDVPPGPVRVEVWKGLEYRPQVVTAHIANGETHSLVATLSSDASIAKAGYYSGDSHIHISRQTDADDQTILDLLEAEDIHFASILAYNEPAGPYQGIMQTFAAPQYRGLGGDSLRERGNYHLLSGQEYRSATYGHLNLYFRNDLVLPNKKVDANNGPLYGVVARNTRDKGGFAFYCHGGYAETNPYAEIYADAIQGNIDGVELLQFGIYRELGLADWYRFLNIGYQFPCLGASDYPACRWLADCRTYVKITGAPSTKSWFQNAAAGHSFMTTGPLLFLDVDGQSPGDRIEMTGPGPHIVTAHVRVRCEVAPVTDVNVIVNGKIAETIKIPAGQSTNRWLEFEKRISLKEPSWIAARAFSTSPSGSPDADAHTNPVYVRFDGRAPYDRASLDALLAKLDKQLIAQKKRRFNEKAALVDYFERSRDILLKIREESGLRAGEDVHKIAEAELPVLQDPGARTHTDAELKAFLKPVPPKTPHEALKTFETIPGFHMELIASEPGVHSPISAAIDENGNLYVTEMIDYPYYPKPGEKPLGSVRLLRDTNGDGHYDASDVFADHLLWAGGVACWKGGVFVAAPPDIWYFKDTDGDHKADIKRKVFTGFGTKSQQYMLNNLKWGLDHKIYGSTAGNGGEIRPGDQPNAKPISVERHDFRFDPVTEEFEPIAGTIQFGNSFDDWGNRFMCDESEPLYQSIVDQRYLARNPYLPAGPGVFNIGGGSVPIYRISPIERWRHIRSSRRISHSDRRPTGAGVSHHVIDAGAGVTIYRGNAYPQSFYGNAVIGDAQNNLVHRMLLSPDGVTFRERRADPGTEFVRSSDNWFRPVNFVNAPDGTLYCLDMSREILESIHIPFDVLKFIDLKAGRDSGRLYRIAPDGFHFPGEPHLGSATTAELVRLLEHPNGWHRDTAHRLLFERQDKSAVPLLEALERKSPLPQARLCALWSLEGLQAMESADLQVALGDTHPALREHAVRLSESRLKDDPAILERVIALSDDENPRVRMQVAYSLGETKDPRAVDAIARIARRDGGDPWIRTAVLSSVAETSHELLIRLLSDRSFVASSAGADMAEKLAYITGVRNRPDETGELLNAVAALANPADAALQSQIVQGVGDGLKQLNGFLRPKSGSQRPGDRLLGTLLEKSKQTAVDSRKWEGERSSAIRLLACFRREDSGSTLAELLSPASPEGVQTSAVAALAGYKDDDIASLLLDRWKESTPGVRAEIVRALLSREPWTLAYLRLARSDSSATAPLKPLERARLLEHKNSAIRDLAKTILGRQAASPRSAVIAEYKSCLSLKGTVAGGRKIYERECSICHQIGKTGHAIGPSLASSNAREPEALLTHVLDPNLYIPPQYVQYVAIDRNGRTYTGILADQTSTSISLKREKDAVDTLLRSNIEELSSTGKSLMPEGFEKKLTRQDMADLIAYLQTVQANVPAVEPPLDIGTRPGLMEP